MPIIPVYQTCVIAKYGNVDVAWLIAVDRIKKGIEKIMPGFIDILVKHKVILAGGAIGSALRGETPADYDFYIPDVETLGNLLNQNCFRQDRTFIFETKESAYFKEVYKSDSAITYQSTLGGPRIQIIHNPKMIGPIQEIINKFDFTICMAAYDLNENIYFVRDYLTDNISKRLVFNINTPYPISSLFRVQKYIKKGFRLGGLDAVKMALRINNINLSDHNELKDQLQGVDTLLLKDLVDKLGEYKKANDSYEFKTFIEFANTWFMEKIYGLVDDKENE